MTPRTISTLPPCGLITAKNSLFEVSVKSGEKYISKNQTIGNLQTQFEAEISSNIAREFEMLSGGTKYSLAGLSSAIHAISCEDAIFTGTKEFTNIPVVTTNLTSYNFSHSGLDGSVSYSPDQLVPNVLKVKDLIDERANFIGSGYVIDGDPGSDEAPRFTTKSDEFIYFRMDDNGTDSSKWIDPETSAPAGAVVCPRTGYLTLFGWLADNGNVLAQDAWVGLYAQILLASESSSPQYRWIPLQIQPWIIGARSSIRQYVGFNLPVKEGLKLKIKTGFRVNGSTSGMQDEATKSFNLNEPNCFVGWVVHPT